MGIRGGGAYYFEKIVSELTDLVVPTFFVLSGYLFYQNFSYSVLPLKYKKRFFSIILPYFIWNIVAYLYYEVIDILPIIGTYINQEIEPFNIEWFLRNMIFGHHNITWFLRNLILYIYVGPILYPLLKQKITGLFVIVFVVLMGAFTANRYILYAPMYIFGAYIGIHFKFYIRQNYSSITKVIALAYIFLTTVPMIFLNEIEISLYIPLRLSQVVAIWIIADWLPINVKPGWWMKISFFIYCTHSMILESVEKLFLIFLGNNILGAFVDIIFAPLITISLIILVAYILKKDSCIWKILTGNR